MKELNKPLCPNCKEKLVFIEAKTQNLNEWYCEKCNEYFYF